MSAAKVQKTAPSRWGHFFRKYENTNQIVGVKKQNAEGSSEQRENKVRSSGIRQRDCWRSVVKKRALQTDDESPLAASQ